MKMIAAVLEQCGQPLQLLELEIPKLKRGQVLVRIAYSAICRSQLMEINGVTTAAVSHDVIAFNARQLARIAVKSIVSVAVVMYAF